MMVFMKVRCVSLACVSAAFLAAIAMTGSSALATSLSEQTELTRGAYQALQSGDAKGAIAAYSKAIDSGVLGSEVLVNALLNRALAHQQVGMTDNAIADYTAALGLDAMSPSLRATALYNRGLSHQKATHIGPAIEDFTSALLLNPEFSHAFYSRGTALRDSGQLLFALSDYERAARYKYPDMARIHYGEALTYMALKRPQDARKALNAVLAIDPQHAAAQKQLAKLGDSASLSEEDADPILTGSAAAISGGTVAIKNATLRAVDVPQELYPEMPASATVSKKIVDRVPMTENASYTTSSEPVVIDQAQPETSIAIEQVPAIPAAGEAVAAKSESEVVAPVQKLKAEKKVEVTSTEEITDEQNVSPTPDGWMVQLASASSEEAAWSTWKKMQKTRKVLRNLNPIVVKADLGTKGTFYRVRLHGFEDQGAAKSACGKLKSGGVSCYVSKG
jgi:SPOR domain/Tetratricopeptide repeat